MGPITIIEDTDLDHLLAVLDTGQAGIYRIRIHQTADGQIKIKVNERTWTPPLGVLDA